MNYEWLQTVVDKYADLKNRHRVVDKRWLQTVVDKYAAAKYRLLGDVVKDVSFLYCGNCGIAVYAFRIPQQLACYQCVKFLCYQCTTCHCGAAGQLISDGDNRVGRLTEYCTRSLIHGCPGCDEFFFDKKEYDVHVLQHEMADVVAPTLIVQLSPHHTKTIADVGRLRYNGRTVESVFAPYPRHVDVDAAGLATITAVFGDPVICNPVFRRCGISVAHISAHSRTSREVVPRPVCFSTATGVTLLELQRWLSLCKIDAASAFLVYYVAASSTTDAFCVAIVDTPWVAQVSVVCPGCCDWFPFTDAFGAHVLVNLEYIKGVARRVDPLTARLFTVSNACASFAHACDLTAESKQHRERPTKADVMYGTMVYPVKSRGRFIGVRCTTTHIECARCGCVITPRKGHTATSMLHPIAVHWMVEQHTVISFSRVSWTGDDYSVDGPGISEIMMDY